MTAPLWEGSAPELNNDHGLLTQSFRESHISHKIMARGNKLQLHKISGAPLVTHMHDLMEELFAAKLFQHNCPRA
jgi:hypothetical protein